MKMSKDKPSHTQKFEKINLILDEIKELGKFKGVLLSTRDGGLISENIGKGADYNEFAAMCASVLESAEGLGKTFGVNKIGKIIAELEEQTIVIVECDTKRFLTFLIEKDSKIDIVFDNLTKYYQKIIDAY
jgi:predicted regulator of Ras-like GTPase activity (Roadblock/LC7/MglB family)